MNQLKILENNFTIHRFESNVEIPLEVLSCSFFSIAKTDDELSIMCPDDLNINSDQCEKRWRCIKVLGPLDFSQTGIIAKLSGILAKTGISIFTISTYDTDYVLVKSEYLNKAVSNLESEGYEFI